MHQLKRYEEALMAYDKALEIQKKDYLVWYNRGNALYNLGRYQDAIASYDEAIYQQMNHAESWYSRGNAFVNLKQYPEAISSYDKALQYHPDYKAAIQAKEQAEKQIQDVNINLNSTFE
uniref:TPR repeat-containing protein slr0751 n=1 Tax=Planktothrix pseudagardhii TaxID=132604 RepID=A0A9W4GBN9_9CYAN|nr:TPR repeat-containing protein slr0751 [Planktothrix pseudagardhii]